MKCKIFFFAFNLIARLGTKGETEICFINVLSHQLRKKKKVSIKDFVHCFVHLYLFVVEKVNNHLKKTENPHTA